MRPAITSFSASAGPLNGMCCALKPPLTSKCSAAELRRGADAGGGEVELAGLALAAATRSATVFQPFDGETTSTLGWHAERSDAGEILDRVVGQLLVERWRR